jgi:hypothetical protein
MTLEADICRYLLCQYFMRGIGGLLVSATKRRMQLTVFSDDIPYLKQHTRYF